MTATDSVAGRHAAPETASVAPAIELRGISKAFGPVQANKDIDLTVARGSIHGIVGENGAGKSTLMKVLSGVYPHGEYEGDIVYDGAVQRFGGIHDSEAAGVIIIHQELALVPQLSVLRNALMGRLDDHGALRTIRLARPPVNALDPTLCAALIEAVESAVADGCEGLVLAGGQKVFSAGLDVPFLMSLGDDTDALRLTSLHARPNGEYFGSAVIGTHRHAFTGSATDQGLRSFRLL